MIRIEKRGPVTCLVIDRPEVLNALSVSASVALSSAIDDFEADDRASVAILTGTGDRAFCVGADLKARESGAAAPASGFGGLTRRFDRSKPIIAAVNGLALGSAAEQTSNVQDVRWYRSCRNVRVCRVGPYGRRCHVNRVCKRYRR